MIDALPLLLSDEGYQISRSVRLRSSASAYFNRTFGTPTSTTTWSLSFCLKRSNLTANAQVFSNGSDFIYFGGGTFVIKAVSGAILETTQVFRDPSAWYHFLVVADTSNATANNRVRLYVNGTEVTAFSSRTNPSLSAATIFNASSSNNRIGGTGSIEFYDGYLTEINFIDGQALTPSSFGETNAVTGVWQPKKYTGTYGTNGFYLNFSDNSAATAAAIGADYSGNGNNWTPNNISVTAGVTYDSMLDVPTQWADGGNGRGNYATLNPLDFGILGGGSFVAPTNGNLDWTGNAGGDANIKATIAVSTGKWYAEFSNLASAAIPSVVTITTSNTANSFPNQAGGYGYLSTGQKANNAVYSAYGATYTSSDVIGVALDLDAGTVTFYKNGASQGQAFSGLSGTFTFGISDTTSAAITANANFGQRPFAYTPPTGFKALNTLNLPTPTILKGNQYFDAVTWSGTNSNQQVALNFTSDFVWAKRRNGADNHVLYDVLRGLNKDLVSNSTAAEATNDYGLDFDNGPYLDVTGSKYFGTSGNNFVAWNWKEGATQGFDIVTGTSPASGNFNVSHSLGVAPAMIILKDRTNAGTAWGVWHRSLANPAQSFLQLNNTNAVAANANIWGNTAPTSTQFTTQSGQVVLGSANYVAYLFAEVAGFSKAFSYTGNGSADGPFVFCGFRPRWVMWKCSSDASTDWVIYDSARDTYNVMGEYLLPNSSAAGASNAGVDFLSNGFKIKLAGGGSTNTSGRTYIGFALAENPFKNALAR